MTTEWAHLPLTPEHADFLSSHAVTPAVAQRAGVYSITEVDNLPNDFAWCGEEAVPAIAFPWTTPSGRTVVQIRPDTPIEVDWDDRPRKYLWPKESGSPIGVVREDPTSDLVVFVEGTKQSLAAGAYIERGSVYAIAGCRTWSEDGVPVSDLDVVEDKQVIVAFDADVETNAEVWEAAKKFTEALRAEGATEVKYLILPAGGKAGLDDVLGQREGVEKRTKYLSRLVESVTDKLPSKPAKKTKINIRTVGTPDRPLIQINGDRHKVIGQVVKAMLRLDGDRLFNYGGVISELKGTSVEALNRDSFCATLAEVSTCAVLGRNGEPTYQWPDGPTVGASMTKAEEFTELVRISRMPIIRPDGTICATSGYDPDTKTQVILPEDLEGLEIPDVPTPEEIEIARETILEDWLVDFLPSLPTPADKANLLGLMFTPLIRGLVPLVPLAVVDGLQAGVGKNLLADLLAILVTGSTAQPLPYARDDEEVRKVITSAFRTGAELFVFDEAHQIEGANFARALTSITYKDRVLGVSTMAEYPNNVTWLSLGNQVVVNGDMSRRVYRIALHSPFANPQDRAESTFTHPDIRQWTMDNRAEIIGAMLTLVRAWYQQGQPGPAEPISFGSFERWAKIVGGVLHNAGIEGFLGNLIEWRSESDFDRTYWSMHLKWLEKEFGTDSTFTVQQVQTKMLMSPMDCEMPPRIDDPGAKGFPRALGQAYARQKGRFIDGLKLVKSGDYATGHAVKWYLSDAVPTPKTSKTVGYVGYVGPHSDLTGKQNDDSDVSPAFRPYKGSGTSGTYTSPQLQIEGLNGRENTQVRFVRAESE